MIFEPQHFAPDENVTCIHCDKKFNHRIGGILWQGHQDKEGFKETFICSHCSIKVVPAILNDFINLDCWVMADKRHMQYMIDAGEKAKEMIQYAK